MSRTHQVVTFLALIAGLGALFFMRRAVAEPASIASPSPDYAVIILLVACFACIIYICWYPLLRTLKPLPPTDEENRRRDWLYYTSAIKLSAQIAAADGVKHPTEMAATQNSFGIKMDDRHRLGALYQHQFANPEPLKGILDPFMRHHGRSDVTLETLFFGLSEVALADGTMHENEFALLAQIARKLRLSDDTATRLLFAAGYSGATTTELPFGARPAFGQKQGGQTAPAHPLTERGFHLAKLGLGPSADTPMIHKTWRKLAAKYHPDKLVSQNLPAEEKQQAAAIMRDINEAYAWLKEHTR